MSSERPSCLIFRASLGASSSWCLGVLPACFRRPSRTVVGAVTAAALALSVLAPGPTLAQETLAAVTQGDARTPGPQAGASEEERCKYIRAVKGDTPFVLDEDEYQTSDVDPFYLTRNDTHLPDDFKAPADRRARCLSGFGVAIDPGSAASAAGAASGAATGVPGGAAAAGSGFAAAGAIGAISLPVIAAAVVIPAAVIGAVVATSGSGSSAIRTTGSPPSE